MSCFSRMPEDIYQTAKVAKILMLLNEGKGEEFKGKSLAEIEISEDLLELEKDEEDEIEKYEEINEKKETKEMKPENCFVQITSECGHECEQREMKEDADNMLPKTGKTKTQIKGVKKRNRHTWTIDEKKLVLAHFKKHIRSKKAPRKNECLAFISKHPNIFKNDDWVRIKTLIYNTYRQK